MLLRLGSPHIFSRFGTKDSFSSIIYVAIALSLQQGVCVFVAASIHYFYLAGFAWMLFEGVYLYLMVVKVFNTEVRMRLFYAVAWGE